MDHFSHSAYLQEENVNSNQESELPEAPQVVSRAESVSVVALVYSWPSPQQVTRNQCTQFPIRGVPWWLRQ